MALATVGTDASVRTDPPAIPFPRRPVSGCSRAAVDYQRLLHQLARREFRMLADLTAWAPADERARTATLTRHADLMARVLLHHHTAEREALWPALVRVVPADRRAEAHAALDDWSSRCSRIDAQLRDLATAARQWTVTAGAPARDSFARACRRLAEAVDAQTADEERRLLPLLATHLRAEDWDGIARSTRCRLPAADQLLVLGLALEDACATDRARVLDGLPRATRMAWQVRGQRYYRAAVVRLRGAPPAR